MATKDLLIATLSSPKLQASVLRALESSSDIKVAVPCAVLSKGARGSSSKVVVTIKGSAGGELLLDCGSFWKGAPTHLVRMRCEGLLQYANEDALRTLAKKLAAQGELELPPALCRPPSCAAMGPRQEVERTAVSCPPSSRMRSPSVATSASATPTKPAPPGAHGTQSKALFYSVPVAPSAAADGSSTLVALSMHSVELQTDVHSVELQTEPWEEGEASPSIVTPFKPSSGPSKGSRGYSGSHSLATPTGPDAPPLPPTKGPRPASCSVFAAAAAVPLPCNLSRALSLGDWVPDGPTAGGGTRGQGVLQQGVAEMLDVASFPSGSVHSAEPGMGAQTLGSLELAAGGVGYHSQQEEDMQEEGKVCSGSQQMQQSPHSSGARQRQASLPRMLPFSPRDTADNFSHVFFAPWSAVCDEGTQTDTAASGGEHPQQPPQQQPGVGCAAHAAAAAAAASSSSDMASAHFDAFQQYFAAGLPHLAMTLVELHSAHGAADPIFVKAQLYLKTCLQIKDELAELIERHADKVARSRA